MVDSDTKTKADSEYKATIILESSTRPTRRTKTLAKHRFAKALPAKVTATTKKKLDRRPTKKQLELLVSESDLEYEASVIEEGSTRTTRRTKTLAKHQFANKLPAKVTATTRKKSNQQSTKKQLELPVSESDSEYKASVIEERYTRTTQKTKTLAITRIAKKLPAKETATKGKKSDQRPRKKQLKLPVSLPALNRHLERIGQLCIGKTITKEVSYHVLRYIFMLQRDEAIYNRKNQGKGKGVRKKGVQAKICRYFSLSPKTYQKFIHEYLVKEKIYASGTQGYGRKGNTLPKITRIPDTNMVKILVRNFVCGERKEYRRVTGRQVYDFLKEKKILVVPDNDKAHESAMRSTRRFLQRNGYHHGKRTGNMSIKRNIIVSRDTYLLKLFANKSLPPKEQFREVYLDESYIHQHYHRFDDSVYDPNNDQDLQTKKMPSKGHRICFAAAIQGPNPRIKTPKLKKDLPGLVPNSLWHFQPQSLKKTADYHKAFNGSNFGQWFQKTLLPNLKQPSIIMMDNAKYHVAYGDDVPRWSKLKKQECRDYLDKKGVDYGEKDTVPILKDKVKSYLEQNVLKHCEQVAKDAGHQLLLTPPYHSDLQPIELVWAKVKGNVGRKYAKGVSLDTVQKRLLNEFQQLEKTGHSSISRMIATSTSIAEDFFENEDDEALPQDSDSDKSTDTENSESN